MAGPFTREDFNQIVPADKKLSPEWVKLLFARGGRTVYRGKELEKIGMPIGGICTGQLYLGGDGKLWHWDIFNQPRRTDGSTYQNSLVPTSPLEQGFALEVTVDGKKQVRPLTQAGCILRAYREHQMTPDGVWLKDLWPNIKLAMQCLIQMDKGDGILVGHQWNTLDAGWYGQIAWLSGLYLVSLRAAAEMAVDMGDIAFAAECRKIADTRPQKHQAASRPGVFHQPDRYQTPRGPQFRHRLRD